jgi:hypothetical protein
LPGLPILIAAGLFVAALAVTLRLGRATGPAAGP